MVEIDNVTTQVCPHCGGDLPRGARRCWLCREDVAESGDARGASRRLAGGRDRSSGAPGGKLLTILGWTILGATSVVLFLIAGFVIGVVAVFGAFLSICSSMN